jgi:SAM-dependent methyltransferase
VDSRTLAAYERRAESIFTSHTTANRLAEFQHLLRWLLPGEPTADVGSGSGVVLTWLVERGFPAVGYEPVAALRELSLMAYPELDVRDAALPTLDVVQDKTFGNVVCSAVLMHLPLESIPSAIANLARILRPGGRLVMSYRRSRDGAEREDDGRLFTPIPPQLLTRSLQAAGLTELHQSTNEDTNRPGVTWTEVVAERNDVRAS